MREPTVQISIELGHFFIQYAPYLRACGEVVMGVVCGCGLPCKQRLAVKMISSDNALNISRGIAMVTVAMVIESLTFFSFVPPPLKVMDSFSFNERNVTSEMRDT